MYARPMFHRNLLRLRRGGCQVLTPQHENLVRKGERLIFCEHCSRIHYWMDNAEQASSVGVKKRRRRVVHAMT
jgi:hypothetical protein